MAMRKCPVALPGDVERATAFFRNLLWTKEAMGQTTRSEASRLSRQSKASWTAPGLDVWRGHPARLLMRSSCIFHQESAWHVLRLATFGCPVHASKLRVVSGLYCALAGKPLGAEWHCANHAETSSPIQREEMDDAENLVTCWDCQKTCAVKWTEITRPSPHLCLCLKGFAFNMQTYDFAREKTLVRLVTLLERDQSPRAAKTVDGMPWMTPRSKKGTKSPFWQGTLQRNCANRPPATQQDKNQSVKPNWAWWLSVFHSLHLVVVLFGVHRSCMRFSIMHPSPIPRWKVLLCKLGVDPMDHNIILGLQAKNHPPEIIQSDLAKLPKSSGNHLVTSKSCGGFLK